MKKLFFMFFLAGISLLSFSQRESGGSLVSKNGSQILPEKGDIGMGIDAVPFLNLLNDKGRGAGFYFPQDIPKISIKYFLSENTALRLSLRLGLTSDKDLNNTSQFYTKETGSTIGAGLGLEKRLGKSRIQGFYGAQLGFLSNKSKIVTSADAINKNESSFGIGADAFIGAEVFFAPKLSIGGEFNWGIDYTTSKNFVNNTTSNTLSGNADNAGGALILSLYF